MEAAALYAYATARERDVVCVAHVTNSMATTGDDFEKGGMLALRFVLGGHHGSGSRIEENPSPGADRIDL